MKESRISPRKVTVLFLDLSLSKSIQRWKQKVREFNMKHQTGFDIRTNDKNRQKQLEEEYQVKMKQEDINLYEDNCREKTCNCEIGAPIKCGQCPRRMFTSDMVDKEWKKWHDRKEKDKASEASRDKKSQI